MIYADKQYGNFAKDPAVIELGGYYYMYYTVRIDGQLLTAIACSEDGDYFTHVGLLPRTHEYEKNGFCAPCAIVIDGVVHLFYQTYGNKERDAICHATSTDGVNFTKDPTNPIFAPREPYMVMPDWSCGRAIDADVCIFGDKLFLYWATRDKAFKRQIVGAAWADAKSDFSRGCFTGSDVIALEPTLDWEQDCIEAPATLVHNNRLYMFYAGAYNCAPQQIGCAVSEDGVNFTRLFINEPFKKVGAPDEWNSSESGHPYIYRANDGRIWLYYQGSCDMGNTWYLSRCEVKFDGDMPVLVD